MNWLGICGDIIIRNWLAQGMRVVEATDVEATDVFKSLVNLVVASNFLIDALLCSFQRSKWVLANFDPKPMSQFSSYFRNPESEFLQE